MNILIYLIFFLFSLGQLGRISFYNEAINFYLYEILLFIVFLHFLLKERLKPIISQVKIFFSLMTFTIILLLSFLLNIPGFTVMENTVAFLYLLRLIFYIVFFIYLRFVINKQKQLEQKIKKGLNFLINLFIISSITQFFLYPDLRNLYYLGWDPHLNRLFGVFFDTSIAAASYGLIFLYVFKRKSYVLSFIYLVFVILTFSRAAYLGIIIIMIIKFITVKNYQYLALFLLSFLLILLLVPKKFGVGVGLDRIFSIEARLNDYKQAFTVWKKAPILGIGYNRIGYVKDSPPSHSSFSFTSSYLNILVSSGVVGLLGFLGVLGAIWKRGEKYRPYLLFLILFSFADNIFLHPYIIFLCGLIFLVDNGDRL